MITRAVGINYEGGKITQHASNCDQCVGYINAQIAMDAPLHDQVADESVRSLGRSELSMEGYDEAKLVQGLSHIISTVKEAVVKGSTSFETSTIIQIARWYHSTAFTID